MGCENNLGTLFASLFGRAWDQMGQKCQCLAKKANFGPNLAVYGPKILSFMEVSKSFGTHIMEKPPGQFWAKFGRLGPKIQFLGGGSKTFGTLLSGNQ